MNIGIDHGCHAIKTRNTGKPGRFYRMSRKDMQLVLNGSKEEQEYLLH